MKVDLKTWVIWALRKASYRWPPRQQALRDAAATREDYNKYGAERVSKLVRNFYWCAKCEEVFSRKGVSIDHVVPVVDTRMGWQGFDEFIRRMFCDVSGFQILCSNCHDTKTQRENKVRREYRKRRTA